MAKLKFDNQSRMDANLKMIKNYILRRAKHLERVIAKTEAQSSVFGKILSI